MDNVQIIFLNGEEKTGSVLLFNPTKPTFPFQHEDENGQMVQETIHKDEVKAIQFLKKQSKADSDLIEEKIQQSQFASSVALKLMVEFKDGETLHGTTHRYKTSDPGFFLIPLNPASQSERIYINAEAVKNVDVKRLLGHILVEQNKITDPQLTEALHFQHEQRKQKIGSILVQQNAITESQLQESLDHQKKKRKRLGEILMDAGYITEEQLENALRIQREIKTKKLGQILVELKYITPNDICLALATQLDFPWTDLSRKSIPPEIALLLPEYTLKDLEVIPVRKKGENVIVVATSEPQDPELMGKLRNATTMEVELVIAYEVYIKDQIREHLTNSSESHL